MAGNVSIHLDGALRGCWLGIQRPARIDDGFVSLHHGRDVYLSVFSDRRVLGQADLGNVVGLGCANDLHSDTALSLYRLHFIAIFDR